MLWRVAWVKAMQRREFIAGVGTVAAWPLTAHAQQTKSPRRIAAFFSSRGDDPEVTRQVARFQDELAKLGWLEGQTIHVDYRFADGNVDALAKELVGLQPELIVTQSTVLTVAIQQETHTIPIVFFARLGPGRSRVRCELGPARRKSHRTIAVRAWHCEQVARDAQRDRASAR